MNFPKNIFSDANSMCKASVGPTQMDIGQKFMSCCSNACITLFQCCKVLFQCSSVLWPLQRHCPCAIVPCGPTPCSENNGSNKTIVGVLFFSILLLSGSPQKVPVSWDGRSQMLQGDNATLMVPNPWETDNPKSDLTQDL